MAAAGAEQLAVENRFRLTGALTWYYWIGVERSGNLYYLQVRTRPSAPPAPVASCCAERHKSLCLAK